MLNVKMENETLIEDTCHNSIISISSITNNNSKESSFSSTLENGTKKLHRSLSLSQIHSIVGYKSSDLLNRKERLMR